MDIIVGTAGHIDHGKTALVKALTGVDADRLPEEKQRGITIDLGFAEMKSGDVRIGFVDVPGHERFVKNMLAGASGVDLVLLVAAADEGVMPQTREHLDICRLLHIENGVIAITKTDLVDDETLELAKLDVAELVQGSFLEDAPIFSVSSKTFAGIDELRSGLLKGANQIRRGKAVHEPRLAIDRSFSVKGFGAVVTGTLASGAVSEGDALELLPLRREVRVRGIQTYGDSVKSSGAGRRTAINLGGVGHEEIERGMVLTRAGSATVTQIVDTEIEVLNNSPRALRPRQRVRVHLGTAEVLARVSILNNDQIIEAGSKGNAQLRFESPLVCTHGDRFIIRSYSPQRTIAGGTVLDPSAHKHRRSDFKTVVQALTQLETVTDGSGNVVEIFVRMSGEKGMRLSDLRSRTALRFDVVEDLVSAARGAGGIVDAGGVLIAKEVFDRLKKRAIEAVKKHHQADKLARGLSKEILREKVFKRVEPEVFRTVVESLEYSGKIAVDHDVIKIPSHETKLTPAENAVYDALNDIYSKAGLEPPKLEDALDRAITPNGSDQKSARKIFQLFVDRGDLVAVTAEYYFSQAALDRLIESLRDLAKSSGDPTIDVAKFKEIAGVSRKYAIPLLEYFDRARVTRRVGDKRQILDCED